MARSLSSVDTEASDQDRYYSCVKVAVQIRPLLSHELLHGCKHCVIVHPSNSQHLESGPLHVFRSTTNHLVQIGTHSFAFDHVYGSTSSPSSAIFKECVSPLVDGLFQGYNATVLAYGQTGSGKTYTMGTGFKDGLQNGLIPLAMNTLFEKIHTLKDKCEFQIVVSFIEIHKEEVIDLLDPSRKQACANGTTVRADVPGKPPIQIRESSNGLISLSGCTEVNVDSINEMAACLEQGSRNRRTGNTDMNDQSSRSHAIFTILLEQRRKHCVLQSGNIDGSSPEDYLCAKLHLVDLAGSERVKKTGTDGLRFKEGVHINKGLLALGNVISALGHKKRKGVHVPYRQSKLTRLLQDSLGGNSRTLMVACVSPADINAEETLNTLKYANRSRNIENKPVVNRDPVSSEVLKLRQQLSGLQEELSRAQHIQVQGLNERIVFLEAKNEGLLHELHMHRSRCAVVEDYHPANYQVDECKAMRSKGLTRGPPDQDSTQNRISEITGEIREVDDDWEPKLLQTTMDKEFDESNSRFHQKESEMKRFGCLHAEAMKQHNMRIKMELETAHQDRDQFLTETESRSSNAEPLAQKFKLLDAEAHRKQENQIQLMKHKEKSDEVATHLQREIQFLKGQKIQLQHKMKVEAEQYRLWKASQDKELLKLRKEGMRNEFERRKLQAFNQRQKLVLQRKTEEAAVATKRLKALLQVKKSSGRGNAAVTNESGSSMQHLLDHELEVMVNAHEVRSEYEKQCELRATLAEELSNLKQVNECDSQGKSSTSGKKESSRVSSMSPNARALRISYLESMMSNTTNSLLAMASKLSESEERERTLLNSGCWNQLRSMGDAKDLLKYMFVSLSVARCQLRERDKEIMEMKENMKELVNIPRQNETQTREIENCLKSREQAPASALADSPNSSTHLTIEVTKPLPAPKKLKYAPETSSPKESAAFFNQPQKMPATPLSMNPVKLWSRKRSHHQLLLQFKWKWEKPWKLSEWMKHSDETIMTARLPAS